MWATEREPDERPVDARAMLDRLREIEKDLGVFPHVVRTPAPGLVAVDEGVDSGEVTKIMPGTFTAPSAVRVAVTWGTTFALYAVTATPPLFGPLMS